MASTAGTTASPSTGSPRRGVFLTLMVLIALWTLPQLVVALGAGTLTVDGRAEYAGAPLDPLAGVSAGLTLLMVVVGFVAERRGGRQRARTCVAGAAVTGLLLVIPTLLAVLALLVAPLPRPGSPGG